MQDSFQKIRVFLGNALFVVTIVAAIFSLASIGFAQLPIDSLSEDLAVPGAVQFTDVSVGDLYDTNKKTAGAQLNGAGTLTLQDSQNSFPRIGILGGTSIQVTSYAGNGQEPVAWNGVWLAPRAQKNPNSSDISFVNSEAHQGNGVRVLQAFRFGEANEVYSFNPRAEMAFRVNEPTGLKVYFAFDQGGNTWTIQDDKFCIVDENSICRGTVGRVSSIALIEEIRRECPATAPANATLGAAPQCRILCNNGFELNTTTEECTAINNAEVEEATLLAELEEELKAAAPKEDIVNDVVAVIDTPKISEEIPTEIPKPVIALQKEKKPVEVVRILHAPKDETNRRGGMFWETEEENKDEIDQANPNESMMAYIRAAAAALTGGDNNIAQEASKLDLMYIAKDMQPLPSTATKRLPHAGATGLLALAGLGLGVMLFRRKDDK